MAEAARIFDPLFLAGKSDAEIITILHPLAYTLIHFGYTHFTDDFIVQLKKKIPNIVEEANKEHDLDTIKPSTLFQTRMEKRMKRKKLDKNTVLDWKMDDREYACRIWEW